MPNLQRRIGNVNEKVVIRQKGADDANAASVERKSSIFVHASGILYKGCRATLIDKNNISKSQGKFKHLEEHPSFLISVAFYSYKSVTSHSLLVIRCNIAHYSLQNLLACSLLVPEVTRCKILSNKQIL